MNFHAAPRPVREAALPSSSFHPCFRYLAFDALSVGHFLRLLRNRTFHFFFSLFLLPLWFLLSFPRDSNARLPSSSSRPTVASARFLRIPRLEYPGTPRDSRRHSLARIFRPASALITPRPPASRRPEHGASVTLLRFPFRKDRHSIVYLDSRLLYK